MVCHAREYRRAGSGWYQRRVYLGTSMP